MQENGLINHWLKRQLFDNIIKNATIKNSHNQRSNAINCIQDVFKMEKKFQLTTIHFLKVTLNGLRILFDFILGGFAFSIVILFGEITVFYFGSIVFG